MNTDMWEQLAVQRNWQQVQQNPRFHGVGPSAGLLACDRVGAGRMAEPEEILPYIHSLLYTHGQRDLSGKKILISAGGTREFLDPVRFIGNPSTGKMGIALAQAAAHRGGTVTLVHSPLEELVMQALPTSVQTIPVISAAEMQQAMIQQFPRADWTIMAAAVADVKPADYSSAKLPKSALPEALPLAPVPDIVAALAQVKTSQQRLIGFAAQSGDIITPAKEKLQRKHLDAIAANPIDQPDSGFGSDQNQAVLIDANGRQQAIAPCSKLHLAHYLLDFIQSLA
jgi:phosphopantothenoylcysteine decarboxylase/phosphopantothenate--cysteine ligase